MTSQAELSSSQLPIRALTAIEHAAREMVEGGYAPRDTLACGFATLVESVSISPTEVPAALEDALAMRKKRCVPRLVSST